MMATLLPTVRARFMGLLFGAAVPLFALGAFIAWQNAQIVAARTRQQVFLAREAAVMREHAFLSESERLLIALSLGPLPSDGADCGAALRRVVQTATDRYRRIAVVGPSGEITCDSGGDAASGITPGPAFDSATRTNRFSVGPPQGLSKDEVPVLPVALPLDGGAAMMAWLRFDRMAVGEAVAPDAWLISGDGVAVSLDGGDAAALPIASEMKDAANWPDGVSAGRSRDGRGYEYAVAALPGDARILLGAPDLADRAAADVMLGRRLAELAIVLLAGVAGVAFGADLLIGRPLKQVAAAVGRWRAGGKFDIGRLRGAPAEIRELARSFSEATAALDTRERQLRASAARQEALMQEIHHRVKNNLQVVASLLNLQASRIRQPDARDEFHTARDRVSALATLHRHLYAGGELHTINMRAFLEELCRQLLQSRGPGSDHGAIALEIEAADLRISSDQAVPMALLVTEAVSNALKYAFPDGRAGRIAVKLRVQCDGEGREIARLEIDDDGVGMGATLAEAGNTSTLKLREGLGLQLMRGFARQLGAVLEVADGPGTGYVVNIVLRSERAAGGDASPRAADQERI